MITIPQNGDIITSPQLPGPARVIFAAVQGIGVHIQAVELATNVFYDRVFSPDEFAIRRVGFDADGERFRLAALAERIRAAAQFDPQFAVGASQIEPLPHQIDAVYNWRVLKSRGCRPERLLWQVRTRVRRYEWDGWSLVVERPPRRHT
ncbi:MAG: hypothetical protein M3Y58_01665, partial [Chloroflexota bacterium]|nr:hypothetical protein [Chloroflexota bacterium]